MGVASAIFAGVAVLAVPQEAQAFVFPYRSRVQHGPRSDHVGQAFRLSLSPRAALVPNGRHVNVLASRASGGVMATVRPNGRFRRLPTRESGGSSASDARRRLAASVAIALSSAGGEGEHEAGGAGPGFEGGVGATPPQGEGSADAPVPDRKPAEPVGAAGAMEDDLLVELVGQDYGMMALLRNDKFRGLIVLLRNIPPNEWVAEVARAYPGDDEIKGMLGQVGKLMHMIDYYQAKKPRK